jgi:hypothetical protein
MYQYSIILGGLLLVPSDWTVRNVFHPLSKVIDYDEFLDVAGTRFAIVGYAGGG